MNHTAEAQEDWAERLRRALGDEQEWKPEDEPAPPMRVLVLDDDGIDRKSMTKALGGLAAIAFIESVATVADARTAMEDGGFDIVFLDYHLPDGVGLSLLPDAQRLGVSAIMVTGAGNERVAVTALNEGAADYLVKDVRGNYLRLVANTVARVSQDRAQAREREQLLRRVSDALETIRLMRNFVSICSLCKKVQVTEQDWEPIEVYVSRRSKLKFSHGYCPSCFAQVRDKLDD